MSKEKNLSYKVLADLFVTLKWIEDGGFTLTPGLKEARKECSNVRKQLREGSDTRTVDYTFDVIEEYIFGWFMCLPEETKVSFNEYYETRTGGISFCDYY